MSLRLRLFILLIVLILVILMTRMIKSKKIDLRYSLIWYLMCLVVIVLDFFPGILGHFAYFLGIEIPANMVFLFAILLLIINVFLLTTKVSKISSEVRRLTQELALAKQELEEIKK